MTIAEVREKCKSVLAGAPRDILIFSVILAASVASFGLGYFAGIDATGQGSRAGEGRTVLLDPSPAVGAEEGAIVASKSGTKYYLPSCSGAERISAENRVYFTTAAAAAAAGYSPATNCKGL